MQCVILAAGNGKRLRPLTSDKPKPLVKVCGECLINHVVGALPSSVDELIIVIGYKGEMIKKHCGGKFLGRKVTYVEQEKQSGPADALWLCKNLLHGRFFLIFADDIHGSGDLERAASFSRAVLAATSTHPERFGVIVRNPDGTLFEITEKPEHPESNLVTTGPLVLDQNIFKFNPETPIKGEYFLPEIIQRYIKEYPMAVVEQELWIPIGYPEDIDKAEAKLCPSFHQLD